MVSSEGKLYRSRHDYMVAGVCKGLADYFGVDVTIVRIITVLAAFSGGLGLIAYIACMVIIPQEPVGTDSEPIVEMVDSPNQASERAESARRTGGLLLAGVGVLLLADQFVRWMDIGKLWPVLLVVLGLGIAFRKDGGGR